MAKDLIPPPAPSGRPALQGTSEGTPRLVELPPERATVEAPAPPRRHLAPTKFRNRFGFLVGALGGALIAAAAVTAIVLSTGGPPNEGLYANWSSWRPQDRSLTGGGAEIAKHVETQYRLGNGKQLVSVAASGLEVQGVKLDVALRPGQGDIQMLSGGHAIRYTLNGLGPRGSILGGEASKPRHQLLRREALELALYSFRYLPDADIVVTLLPPPPPAKDEDTTTTATAAPVQAVFYRPGDLRSQLLVPLGVTVPAKAPKPETMGGEEGKRVDSLTLSNLFQMSYTQTPDGNAYMVLDHVS
jgi:hypothetical protein